MGVEEANKTRRPNQNEGILGRLGVVGVPGVLGALGDTEEEEAQWCNVAKRNTSCIFLKCLLIFV